MLHENTDVADTIAKQMGGIGALKAMLGAKVFALDNGLKFKWPNKERSRGNVCVITLDPDDTYSMEFFNGAKSVEKFEGMHASQLVETFEAHTGWYLTFGSKPKTEARLAEIAGLLAEAALQFEALEEGKGRRLPDGWKMVFGKLRKLFGRQSGYDARSIGLHGQMKSVAQAAAKLAKRRKPLLVSYL